MLELLEFLFHILSFIFELLIKSVICVFKLLLTLFSKKQRDSLKSEWKESKKNKAFIVTAMTIIILSSYAIFLALT